MNTLWGYEKYNLGYLVIINKWCIVCWILTVGDDISSHGIGVSVTSVKKSSSPNISLESLLSLFNIQEVCVCQT